ncbi:phosphoglycerate mutase-like protein [Cylindrobasidium torrendii FP15055 ss-10]|uniref:Phosphoglycerate mutase-like protein n=1 Tax=Cylindrobasidium torrendii FP15055 ss-10 TaxID=1314674 RepID=A0A0D7BA62_9AGAR|nr:phosphoglycerate mutase-like protein [Cylindrobasidium torrendii FP15055 ss-10]
MLTVTFIRHGQSLDNPRGVWGGWKDAPLSPLGERQAAALGEHLSSTRFDYIYASTLSRAKHTGLAVHAKQAHNPPFTENPNLREQHFGIAEGHKWVFDAPDELTNPDGSFDLEGCYARNIFPVGIERFPGGESQADLSVRATQALRECVFPHLNEAKTKDVHVGIASHGLCIGELVSALLSFDPQDKGGVEYTGLENTAWSRAQVELLDVSRKVAWSSAHSCCVVT